MKKKDDDIDFEAWFKEIEYKGPLAGIYLSTMELAELFGISKQAIAKWEKTGFIYKAGPNKWHVPDVIRCLYQYWREVNEEMGRRW